MKPRSLIGLIAAIVVLLAASFAAGSAAAPSASQAPVLRFGILCGGANGGSTLDPIQQGCGVDAVDTFTVDMLENISPSGRFTPGLAQKVTHPNAFVYLYHLRKGVKFSDGTEVTSADVANALNYARYPTSLTRSWYASVRDVKGTDRYTVQITLKRPDASFRYSLAIGNSAARIFEKRQQQANKSTFGQPGTLLIGSRPYWIDSFDPTRGAELSANPKYWGGTPPAKHVSVKFFSDEQSMALAYRAGSIDVAFPGDPAGFASSANTKVISRPGCQPIFLIFKVGVAPFDDIHVRRAVAYAINRADIVRAIGQQATPSYSVITSASLRAIATQAQIEAFTKSLPNTEFNLAKVRAEMAKSKYAGGASTTIGDFPLVSWGPRVAQVIAAALAKIDIKMQVRGQTVAEWIDDLVADNSKKPPPVLSQFGCQDPDPSLNARFFAYSYGGKNPTAFDPPNYINAKADALIDLAGKSSSPAVRFDAYSKALKIYATDLPVLALAASGPSVAVTSKFTFPGFSGYTSVDTPWIMGVKAK